jgi:hypothetical protein
MELLEVCLSTTHFHVDKFFHQKDGTAMGNSLSHIVRNILMEHFEKLAFGSAQHKPTLWLRNVDDPFVVWRLQDFLSHLNSLSRPSSSLWKHSQTGRLPFLMFWSTGNPPILADIPISTATIRCM